MRKLTTFAFMALAFSFIAFSADSALAQGRNREARREYRNEVRDARREYRDDIRSGDSRREARREYRNEVRDARREYRDDRRDNRRDNRGYNGYYSRPPYGRAYGNRSVRPYVGNRRIYNNRVYNNNTRYRVIYRNGRRYVVAY